MKLIWQLFYNILFLPVLYGTLKLLSLFNRKIRKGIRDRKDLFKKINIQLKKLDKNKKRIWFHSASVGEFEQAKPIIEKLKENYKVNIIVTFFSPSGYNSAKKYPYADLITYIPFDTIKNSKKFIISVNPDLVIFMRYDLWPNMMWELSKFHIPTFLVDATMRMNSKRKIFPMKNFHKYLFDSLTEIMTISEKDKEGFLSFGIEKAKIETIGDTRYDRVYFKSLVASKRKVISKNIIKDKKIFIAGSTWKEDEDELLPCIKELNGLEKNLLTIIVPHEPTIENIEQIESFFKNEIKTIRFSLLNQYEDEPIIIIDSIGILLILYSYAHVAFVGGGFRSNIHNILEPAVYGVPVIFGPKHFGSQEAEKLINAGGAFEVKNNSELFRLIKLFLIDENYRIKCGDSAKNFVISNIGATEKTVEILKTYL